jgi:hypothetical protein
MANVPPKWQMVLVSYANTKLGEILDAHDRTFTFNLHAPNTIQFTLPLISSQVSNILTQKEAMILLYRNKKLAMTAEITSIEVTGANEGDHGFTVTAVETMHTRLPKRLLGKTAAGLSAPAAGADQGAWLSDVLDLINVVDHTGLAMPYVAASGTISGGTWRYKPYMELMQELSATVNGFDFYQVPIDPSTGYGLTGFINIKPVIGNTKANVVLEYGTGAANAREYQWLIHNESIINQAYALPPQFPDNVGNKIATATASASIALRGLREEVIPTDLSDYTLRSQLATLHINLRKQPREQFIIQPAQAIGDGRVPEFLDDYNIGDMIRGRVQDQGILMLDAMVRMYGVNVSLSDEGQETVDLTLINDGAATS